MPIIYIGRQTTFKGKSLWEILGNLKNNGVGRMVIRSCLQRYPEACYMRILKVAALPNADQDSQSIRKVAALVQRTFRGKTEPKPIQIDSTSYKGDYVLIPKDQEARYLNASSHPAERLLPKDGELPPVLAELLLRQAKQAGKPIHEAPKLTFCYNTNGFKYYRVANENETPTVVVPVNLGPTLYASNVKKKDPSPT